jgi:hypothetical protein
MGRARTARGFPSYCVGRLACGTSDAATAAPGRLVNDPGIAFPEQARKGRWTFEAFTIPTPEHPELR